MVTMSSIVGTWKLLRATARDFSWSCAARSVRTTDNRPGRFYGGRADDVRSMRRQAGIAGRLEPGRIAATPFDAFSSSVIAKSFPGYGAYIASKAGVEGLVPVLANELRGRQITVNAVAPGPVATELFLKGKTEAQVEQFGKLAPLERLGRPEDIADVVSFLAGPDGGWVNAQVLRANGGFA